MYLTPLIGGYIADKYWGIRRSVFWGAMMMAVGVLLVEKECLGEEQNEDEMCIRDRAITAFFRS